MKRQTFKVLFSVIFIAFLAFAVGCGGGGGGGGSNPVAPGTDLNPGSVVAPGTSVLATDGSFYTYASTNSLVALKVPVDSNLAKYALVVTNPNTTAQSFRLKPESYVLGTVRHSLKAESSAVSVSDYGRLLQNQAPLEQRLRMLASQRGSIANVRASYSLRASDHSNEAVGDIVQLKIVADWWGTNYITRNCKLERMTANCKIFVDQDEYQGLSAVEGADKVTSADLDHFAYEFETYIHNLILNSYSQVYDIDNDGRVSILISPVYSKLGFAGLFNSNNFADNANSNQRDLISLFSPDSAKNWTGERWREATRETICHEMQHLVNYSAHFYFNNVGAMEEEWLDESLSVGVEARYRILRGSPVLENRFSLWAESPSSVGLLNFNRALSQYGMVGLFNFFLYEQSDDATIKALVNASELGKANVDARFSGKGGMNGIFRAWAMAALMDTLRAKNMVDITRINTAYKYKTAIGLDVNYTPISFGYSTDSISVPAYGAAFYVMSQPWGFNSDEYQFRIESESGKTMEILMVRLP